MIDIANVAKEWLKSIAPLATILFAILTTAGFIKWLGKTKNAILEITKTPVALIVTIIVVGIFLFFYYKFLEPLL